MRLLSIFLIMFVSGCGYLHFNPGAQDTAFQIAALNAGSEFAYAYEEHKTLARDYCNAIIESDGTLEYLFDIGKVELSKIMTGNATQAASMQILMDSIVVDGKLNDKNFKQAAIYFKRGLELR